MNALAQTTFRYDRLRAAASGVIESAQSTFILLIAVSVFQADGAAKGIVSAGGNVGLLVAPVVVAVVERLAMRTTKAASIMLACGAVAWLIVAAFPALPLYVMCAVIAGALSTATAPLQTQVYQDNYSARERGRLFSTNTVIRVAVTALFAELFGRLLAEDLGWHRLLFVALAAAYAFAAFCFSRIPSKPLHVDASKGDSRNPFKAMRFVRDDAFFRWTIVAWMFMGFGNLVMSPLRVEYLANPVYGVALSARDVALYTAVIPAVVRLVASPFWGRVFDRANFMVMRIILNFGLGMSIIAFFTGNSAAGLTIGSIIFGASIAGGDLAWSLWVTKFAAPERVAEYMSVHTFFTGVRGVIAPLVGFALIERYPVDVLGWFCFGLIMIGTAILVPEIRSARLRK